MFSHLNNQFFSVFSKNSRPLHSCHFFLWVCSCHCPKLVAHCFLYWHHIKLFSFQIMQDFMIYYSICVFNVVFKYQNKNEYFLYVKIDTYTKQNILLEMRLYFPLLYVYSRRIDLSAYSSHTMHIIKWQIIRLILCESQSSMFI